MNHVITQRHEQARLDRAWKQAADARQFATPYDDDEMDYTAEYERRVDAYLADPDHTPLVSEMLGNDRAGGEALRRIIVDLDDRLRGVKPEGDLFNDMKDAIRDLSERAAELAYQPICDDIDCDLRHAKSARRQMRKHGEVID